ncbi:MAG: hypothetical protein WAM76_17265, partial [Pseudolabrys sp.]
SHQSSLGVVLPQRGDSWGAGRGLVGHALTCAALARSALGVTHWVCFPPDTPPKRVAKQG